MSRTKTIVFITCIFLLLVLGVGYTRFTRTVRGATPAVLSEQRDIYSKRPAPSGPVLHNLVYKRGLFGKQALDIYMPLSTENRSSPPKNGFQTVIFIHGGSWLHGQKEDIRIIDRFVGKMRRQGWAVISIDYVAPPLGLLGAPERNVEAAFKWIKKNAVNYGLDSNRMGLYSVSAGSHLTLCALNKQSNPRSEWRFWLNEYGPVNLVAMAGGEAFDSTERLALIPEFYLRRHSPAFYIDEELPPTIIVHGDADKTVALAQSERLADQLRKGGTDVVFRVIPGGNHGFFNLPQSDWQAMEDEFLPLMAQYFR